VRTAEDLEQCDALERYRLRHFAGTARSAGRYPSGRLPTLSRRASRPRTRSTTGTAGVLASRSR
jgi:hypothetical protein